MAVLAGNLVIQILSLLVVLRTMQLGAGSAVAPGVVIHVVLGALFGYFLLRTRKIQAFRASPARCRPCACLYSAFCHPCGFGVYNRAFETPDL